MDPKCVKCDARCCRYFCIPLGMPADKEDLDTARWYLLHEGASVFIDPEGLWWVRVENRCRMLEDGRPLSGRSAAEIPDAAIRAECAGSASTVFRGRKTVPPGAASRATPRCRDYKGRPLVCRRFSPKSCDYTLGQWGYAQLFRTAEELDEYVRRIPRVGGRKKKF